MLKWLPIIRASRLKMAKGIVLVAGMHGGLNLLYKLLDRHGRFALPFFYHLTFTIQQKGQRKYTFGIVFFGQGFVFGSLFFCRLIFFAAGKVGVQPNEAFLGKLL